MLNLPVQNYRGLAVENLENSKPADQQLTGTNMSDIKHGGQLSIPTTIYTSDRTTPGKVPYLRIEGFKNSTHSKKEPSRVMKWITT